MIVRLGQTITNEYKKHMYVCIGAHTHIILPKLVGHWIK